MELPLRWGENPKPNPKRQPCRENKDARNLKANPGRKPCRENKEGIQHSVIRLQEDNPLERTRKGDDSRFSGNPWFLGYREKTLRKNEKAWGVRFNPRVCGF
jgi:hypothetical protein